MAEHPARESDDLAGFVVVCYKPVTGTSFVRKVAISKPRSFNQPLEAGGDLQTRFASNYYLW